MKYLIPSENDPDVDEYITQRTRQYNERYLKDDYQPLSVYCFSDDREVIGGLVGKTYWSYLEVEFLWVDETQRHRGIATRLMKEAEQEARSRHCRTIILDTYEYQALGFYDGIGFERFGELNGFGGKYDRYYLKKQL